MFQKTNLLKTISTLSILGTFTIFFAASGSAKKTTNPAVAEVVPVKITPRFDYSPPSKGEKCGVTFALVKPKFAKSFEYASSSPFTEFAQNMGTDYEELLTSKGYALRGPFNSRDEMVFNDKSQSNLILEPAIEVNVNVSNLKSTAATNTKQLSFKEAMRTPANSPDPQPQTVYRASGQVTLTGQFSFVLLSPKRNEKVWVKTLPLENKVITINSKTDYSQPPTFSDLMREDVAVFNEVTKALESYYPSTLDLGWRYLEPEEIKQFAADAKQADGGN